MDCITCIASESIQKRVSAVLNLIDTTPTNSGLRRLVWPDLCRFDIIQDRSCVSHHGPNLNVSDPTISA